jgi:hypothetical protein
MFEIVEASKRDDHVGNLHGVHNMECHAVTGERQAMSTIREAQEPPHILALALSVQRGAERNPLELLHIQPHSGDLVANACQSRETHCESTSTVA